jgi:peptidoglycan/LPS O-acetylase OafA/YrhL
MIVVNPVGAISAGNGLKMAHADISRFRSLPQIPALTGLRFFAAFSILFAHACDWLAQFQNSTISANFSFVAIYGMPLFFVLSGFVIHYNYVKSFSSDSIPLACCKFAAARFARLFPLYLFLLLMAIIADNFIEMTHALEDLYARIMLYYVTLTQSWWYVIYENQLLINWLFPLSWSISTEAYFYLAYVSTVFIILLLRGPRAATIAVIGFAVGVTLMFIALRYYLSEILNLSQRHIPDYIDHGTNFQQSFYRWAFYFSPYARVFEFFMGCLTAHAFILLRNRRVSASEQRLANCALIAALAGLALLGAVYLNAINIGTMNGYVQHLALNFLCAPAIAVIMFYVGRYDTSFTRFLSSPTLVALGDTSYSIYLVHTWTLRIFLHPAPVLTWIWGIDALFRVVFAIVFTLLVSYATYRLVEVPSRVWLRAKFGRMIANGFGDAAMSGRTVALADLPPNLQPKSVGAPHARCVFSFAAILLLAAAAVAGQAARSDAVWNRIHRFWFGGRPEIEVVSATYGLNCKNVSLPAPMVNLAAPGNVTKVVKHACDGRQRCEFLVNTARIGDPVNGCGKDFLIDYRCGGSEAIKSVFLPPEAYGKKALLSCDPAE